MSNKYCLYLKRNIYSRSSSESHYVNIIVNNIKELLYLMNIDYEIVENSDDYDFKINDVSVGIHNLDGILQYVFKELKYTVQPPIKNGYTLYQKHNPSVFYYSGSGYKGEEINNKVEKMCKDLNFELKTMFFIHYIPVENIPTDFNDYSVLVDPKGNVFIGRMNIYLHLREMENNNLHTAAYYKYTNPNNPNTVLSSTVCWVQD